MSAWIGVEHLLTPDEAAAALAISRWSLNRLRRDGQLPAVRVGNAWRYDPADITAYITNNRSESQ